MPSLETFYPEDLLAEVRIRVEAAVGDEFPVSHLDPDGAVCLARVANYLAKQTGDWETKAMAFAAASCLPGVVSGWRTGVFFVEGPLGLPASAHDPYGELIWWLDQVNPGANHSSWPEEWDGYYRQPFCWEIASGLILRRKRAMSLP